jgi:murein DD-endopeptidase MepM/ murein hydrolase activator NlpD
MLRSLDVRAAMPGQVVAVGEPSGFEGYGNIVEVAVGGGYTALYAHLASWRVDVGEALEAGQPIATAGCTGSCSGTHLHFELRLRGRAVDPMRFHLR